MIEINGLTKIYKLSAKKKKELKTNKDVKTAVNDLSLTAKPGEITGLLGPNGAGKTTTMRCVATLLSPTKGDIKVCGYDTVKDAQKVRDSICFLTNEIKLDEHFTVDYLFTFFGRLKNLDEKTIEARKKELFDTFAMNDFKDKKIEELSTGMKQKASIVVNLVNDPEVVDPIRFLRQREINHFQRFGESLRLVQDELNFKNVYAFNPSIDRNSCRNR